MPNSAVSPQTLILKGRHKDNACTGPLGSCPGCPSQVTWWTSSSHTSGLTAASQVSLSWHTRYSIRQHTTSYKTLFSFSSNDFLVFVLSPACLHYAIIIIHMVWALTCSPSTSILMLLEQRVATVCDF